MLGLKLYKRGQRPPMRWFEIIGDAIIVFLIILLLSDYSSFGPDLLAVRIVAATALLVFVIIDCYQRRS